MKTLSNKHICTFSHAIELFRYFSDCLARYHCYQCSKIHGDFCCIDLPSSGCPLLYFSGVLHSFIQLSPQPHSHICCIPQVHGERAWVQPPTWKLESWQLTRCTVPACPSGLSSPATWQSNAGWWGTAVAVCLDSQRDDTWRRLHTLSISINSALIVLLNA